MANSLINQFTELHKSLETGFKRCSGYWLVLFCLCNRANKKDHVAFPSVSKISKEVHLSEKMTRRHLRNLESDGFIKTVKNARGGKQGDTRHYKVVLPIAKSLRCIDTPPVDEHSSDPLKDLYPSHYGSFTPPVGDSQTIKQPLITYKEVVNKFGYGWEHDPNRSWLVGKFVGIEARPGELNGPFVARIMDKLSRTKSLI